jgi:hypothetical protein
VYCAACYALCVLRSAFCVLRSAFCVLRSGSGSVLREQGQESTLPFLISSPIHSYNPLSPLSHQSPTICAQEFYLLVCKRVKDVCICIYRFLRKLRAISFLLLLWQPLARFLAYYKRYYSKIKSWNQIHLFATN